MKITGLVRVGLSVLSAMAFGLLSAAVNFAKQSGDAQLTAVSKPTRTVYMQTDLQPWNK